MANSDDIKPFISQVFQISDSESSEHHSPGSFATLSSGGSGDSAIGSPAPGMTTMVGYISSNPTTNRKNKRQSSEVEGYMLVSRDPSNNHSAQHSDNMVTTPTPKRPRGRPPGSKNKPKPPIVVRQQNEPAMNPVLFDIIPGTDVVETLINFARSRNAWISLLSAVGPVSDVVISRPGSNDPGLPIQGPVHMLALTGTYFGGHSVPPIPLPPPPLASNHPPSSTWPSCSSFSALLSGANGQVFGGVVGGKILAAGAVKVMASLIRNPEIHKSHLTNDNGGGDNNGDEGGDGSGNDTSFSSAAINNSAKVITAPGGGGGGSGGGSGSSGAAVRYNKCNSGDVNCNVLPYISAAYGVVGSAPLINCHLFPVIAGIGGAPGANVCNLNVMQWSRTISH